MRDCKVIDILRSTGVKFEPIAVIWGELFQVVNSLPVVGDKEAALHQFFDKWFANVDLCMSFDKKLVIVSEEVFSTEILIALHTWFTKQCCDIRNIVYVAASSVGVEKWYKQYLTLFGYGDRGFTVIDAPMLYTGGDAYFRETQKIAEPSKAFDYYFSSYGGTYSTLPRDFLVAALLTVKCPATIDYAAKFNADTNALENYFESMTSFCDRKFVDQLMAATKIEFIDADRCMEKIDFSGFQYDRDSRSFAQVVRETIDTDYWGSFTEKTVRAFLHRQVVIPISGYAAKDTLVDFGFKFLDIIDYDSYQYESNYGNRCKSLCAVLQKLSDNYSLADLEEYYIANLDVFNYNFEYIQTGTFLEYVTSQLIKKFTND